MPNSGVVKLSPALFAICLGDQIWAIRYRRHQTKPIYLLLSTFLPMKKNMAQLRCVAPQNAHTLFALY